MSTANSITAVPHAGVWPALLTPLNADLSVDHATFTAHIKSLLDAGCSGVTPFGTTGEGPSFSVAERIAAVDHMVANGVSANRILVSTSCASVSDIVTLTKHAVAMGVHGCLMMPPFFLKNISAAGVVDTYRYVIDAVADARLRMMLYHIPQIAQVDLTIPIMEELLARYPQTFIGIKDSSGKRDGSLDFVQALGDKLPVWVGHEPDLRALAQAQMQTGHSFGAVSGVANVYPKLVQRLTQRFDANGYDAGESARDLASVKAFIDSLNALGMAAVFKGVMAIQTGHTGWRRVRPPLQALSDEAFAKLQTLMQSQVKSR